MSGRGGGGAQGRPQGAREPRDQIPTVDVTAIRFGKEIDRKLYSDIAEGAARTIADGARGTKNKPTQLRRFYDELVMLQEKVGSDPERDRERFTQQEPFIQMLKAKVAYAKGREKVDENFEALLRHVVDQIKDPTTLKQAKLFMEAFMAFYKVYGPKD
jgi:CRISPR-associated protein Csm2